MRFNKILALAAIVVAGVGCSKSSYEIEPPVEQGKGQQVTVSVGMASSDDANTKVSITEDGNVWRTQWHAGDKLGGWSSNAAQTKFNEFEMGNFIDENGQIAEFTGTAAGANLRLLYPCDGAMGSISNNKYTVDMSVQRFDLGAPYHHLNEKLYMASDEITNFSASATPNMHFVSATMEVNLQFPAATFGTGGRLYRVELSGAIPVKSSLDLTKAYTEADFLTTSSTGTLRVDIENSPLLDAYATSTYSVKFGILPFKVNANEVFTISVYVDCADGTAKKYTKTVTAQSDVTFARATHNWINAHTGAGVNPWGAGENITTWIGTGDSESDPYLISSRADLARIATNVNGGAEQSGKFFKMTRDIDLGGSEVNQWTAIGSALNGKKFKGTFDGAGYKVTGLYINRPDVSDQGLFGAVGNVGTVKNLGVDGSVTGKNYVGGVAGMNYGTVTNCYNTGSVSGVQHVGGVAGYNNNSTVTNCYNTGSVSGVKYIGGVAGYNNNSTVTNCYNTSSVSGTIDYVGGVVGSNYGTMTDNYYLKGCAKDGDNVAQFGVGNGTQGLTTTDVDGKTNTKSEADMKHTDFVTLLNGNRTDTSKQSEWKKSANYPVFIWQ